MNLQVTPGGPVRGEIEVAADKSISHRAVIFSAIATGCSRVRNLLQGEDVRALIQAFRQMGVAITASDEKTGAGDYQIEGVGLHGLRQPSAPLNMGNSGTALRLVAGLMCGQRWPSTLLGDESLCARPMGRIIEPLTRMGAVIEATDDTPPLHIFPASRLRGIHYALPMASAQVKSSLLLAGLYAEGATMLAEPAPSRDHSERMLAAFGCRMLRQTGRIGVRPTGELRPCDIQVPADLSSAAFFLVAASIIRGSDLRLRNVGINPSRSGVLSILRRMGADIELSQPATVGGEPVADLRVRAAALRGCLIEGDDIALAIDEIPAIAMAAACANGVTEIRDAAELRVKESDRLSAVATGLAALGVAVEERVDGLRITGGAIQGGRVDSRGDHRIAMAFAIAGAAAADAVVIADCDNIATSFPGFCRVATAAGLDITPVAVGGIAADASAPACLKPHAA